MKLCQKKSRNRMIYIIAMILLLTAALTPQTTLANENIDIIDYVSEMQPGWNLGNTLDATGGDETSWGNPRASKELIDAIAAQGYKSIRIPITWDHRMAKTPDYTIDPSFMDRVEEVVNWALDADLYVMINLHHDSWTWVHEMETKYDHVLARYEAAWTQIADRFKDHPEKLMFESINEPRFSQEWGVESPEYEAFTDTLNTTFHEIIRSSGGKNTERALVLPTFETSTKQMHLDTLKETIDRLDDSNLIATVHYYGFWPFSVNIAGHTRFDTETKNDIIETFDRVHDTFVANGIPVILGEYGLLGFDTSTDVIQQGEKLKFFESIIHYAQEKDITHMLWDNGQHFNRHSLEWNDQEFFNMIEASWHGRSATAETNFLYLLRGEPVDDVEMALELNGRQLTDITADGKKLVDGQDYEVNEESILFKGDLLTELSDFDHLGVNAVLTLEFDSGADWNIQIKTYDKPVFHDVEGTTSSFKIPTDFNGAELATMEAVYKSGGNAGPQNWTSFKEFGQAFSPNYDTDEIILQQKFFTELNDGEVILTFHFWSGETIEYFLTKSGNNVVGSTNDSLHESETPAANEAQEDLESTEETVTENSNDNTIRESQPRSLLFILGIGLLVLSGTFLYFLKRK